MSDTKAVPHHTTEISVLRYNLEVSIALQFTAKRRSPSLPCPAREWIGIRPAAAAAAAGSLSRKIGHLKGQGQEEQSVESTGVWRCTVLFTHHRRLPLIHFTLLSCRLVQMEFKSLL